jgi:hypothetical protein
MKLKVFVGSNVAKLTETLSVKARREFSICRPRESLFCDVKPAIVAGAADRFEYGKHLFDLPDVRQVHNRGRYQYRQI